MEQIPNCFYRVSIKALILNEKRDKFLICREELGGWDLPGGGLDWGMGPEEDLRREIMEEMGLNVTWVAENPSYFVTPQAVRNKQWIANIVFEATLEHLDFTHSEECQEVHFVNHENVAGIDTFPTVATLLKMFKPENHQLSGK